MVSFQRRVFNWVSKAFGEKNATDPTERAKRLLEETLELTQACGMSEQAAEDLVKYVYSRPIGEIEQEIGGVMMCIACLSEARSLNAEDCGKIELYRVESSIHTSRIKHQQKPRHIAMQGVG